MTRFSPDKLEALRTGTMDPAKRQRNLVAAFQSAYRERYLPTVSVTGYKPINAVNVRVTYMAPVFLGPERCLIRRYTPGMVGDDTETWMARKGEDGRGSEFLRFEVDALTGEYVKVY